jgi:hypothetical protein
MLVLLLLLALLLLALLVAALLTAPVGGGDSKLEREPTPHPRRSHQRAAASPIPPASALLLVSCAHSDLHGLGGYAPT